MENKICLYIATHNNTGLKYFGKTINYFTKDDLENNYIGSGTYWKRHLKKHGDDVTMKVYGIFSESEVKEIALKFSKDNDIVESKEWANIIPENGFDGKPPGTKCYEETKKKLSLSQTGKSAYHNGDKTIICFENDKRLKDGYWKKGFSEKRMESIIKHTPFKDPIIQRKTLENRKRNGTNIFVTSNPMHNKESVAKKVAKTCGDKQWLRKRNKILTEKIIFLIYMNNYKIKKHNKWISFEIDYYKKIEGRYCKKKFYEYLINLELKPYKNLEIRI